MTVICFKDDVLACDSLWSDNALKAAYTTKIAKLENGFLYGSSGDNDDRDLKKLISRMRPKVNLDVEDFPSTRALRELELNSITAMVIFKQKIFIISIDTSEEGEGVGVFCPTHPFYAIGSGRDLAFGAMEAGASAFDAVKIACKYDLNCEGPIHTLT